MSTPTASAPWGPIRPATPGRRLLFVAGTLGLMLGLIRLLMVAVAARLPGPPPPSLTEMVLRQAGPLMLFACAAWFASRHVLVRGMREASPAERAAWRAAHAPAWPTTATAGGMIAAMLLNVPASGPGSVPFAVRLLHVAPFIVWAVGVAALVDWRARARRRRAGPERLPSVVDATWTSVGVCGGYWLLFFPFVVAATSRVAQASLLDRYAHTVQTTMSFYATALPYTLAAGTLMTVLFWTTPRVEARRSRRARTEAGRVEG